MIGSNWRRVRFWFHARTGRLGAAMLLIGLWLSVEPCCGETLLRTRVRARGLNRPRVGWLARFQPRCLIPAVSRDGCCCEDRSRPAPVSQAADPPQAAQDAARTAPASPTDEPPWRDLFDGQSLQGWRITNFGGEGDVYVEDGQLILDFGSPLTGVTFEGPLPVIDYEIRLEAMRAAGLDFFCGLTFPVNDSYCSLILGGWGGGVIGLSSIDDHDASENETTGYMNLANKTWYQVRVRVTKDRIQAWIDDEQKVDQIITGRKVSIRDEVDLSRPLGIATYDTRGALRNIRLRVLKSEPHAP